MSPHYHLNHPQYRIQKFRRLMSAYGTLNSVPNVIRTTQKETLAPRSSERGLNSNRNRTSQLATLSAVLSTALTLAGIALMLTTYDATVRMLAVCLVANELTGGLR